MPCISRFPDRNRLCLRSLKHLNQVFQPYFIEIEQSKCSIEVNPHTLQYFNKQRVLPYYSVNYRGNKLDLREYWSTNRFEELLYLNYEDGKEFFNNWVGFNGYLKGPNYISVMECSIRSFNLIFFCSKFYLELEKDRDFFFGVSKFLLLNNLIINARPSKYSSEGNHSLVERFGVFMISLLFDKFNPIKTSDRYQEIYIKQVNEDGGGIEQSTGYHFANYQLGYIFNIISKKNDFPIYQDFTNRLSLSECFLSNFVVKEKSLLRYGDWDNGIYFRGKIIPKLESRSIASNYSSSGIIVESRSLFKIIFRYGDLGHSPLYGHGHYDILMPLILFDGRRVNLDSGTHLYMSKYRSHFRSYLSKSTTFSLSCFNNVELSPFMWANNATGKLLNSCTNDLGVGHYFITDSFFPHKIFRVMLVFEDFIAFIDGSAKQAGFTQCSRWYLEDDSPLKLTALTIKKSDLSYQAVSFLPFQENQSLSYSTSYQATGLERQFSDEFLLVSFFSVDAINPLHVTQVYDFLSELNVEY